MRSFTTIIILLLLFHGKTWANVDDFYTDSLTIENNFINLLSNHPLTSEIDTVVFYLKKEVLLSSDEIEDFVQYQMAKYFYVTQQPEKALEVADYNINKENKLQYSQAKFYNIKGAVYTLKKDYKEAINWFLKTADLYNKEGNELKEYSVYNNIANIYIALGDHEQAYRYSKTSFSKFRKYKDDPNYLKLLGVLSICEINFQKLDSASLHIEEGLQMLEEGRGGPLDKAVLDYAKAEMEFQKDNYEEAEKFAKENVEYCRNYRLVDFEVMSSILVLNINNKRKNYQEALIYGLDANSNSEKISNLSVKHSILDGLSIAYAGLNQYQKAYFYKRKSDSIKSIDRDEKNKERLDMLLEKHQTLLKENKILQQEANISNLNRKVGNRTRLIIFTTVILVLVIAIIVIFNRQRIRIINREKKLELIHAVNLSEKKERSRLSSELHDGLASDLTALRLELEQNNSPSPKALNLLAKAHNITRVISHSISPYLIKEKGLIGALSYICMHNYSNQEVQFYTNVQDRISLSLREGEEIVLFRSAQELLQNAIKHAQASTIVVQILEKEDSLTISVEDDGKGFNVEEAKHSVGLGSLIDRIKTIHGEIDIDSAIGKGTNIFIKVNRDA